MDTSKKYIKICKQAAEIQALWKPQDFDFVKGEYVSVIREWKITQGTGSAALKPLFTRAGKWSWYDRNELIWLPRQDQLQTLLKYDELEDAFLWKFEELYIYSRKKAAIVSQITSMEQLWLAFVMHEKYNKEWNEAKRTWKGCNLNKETTKDPEQFTVCDECPCLADYSGCTLGYKTRHKHFKTKKCCGWVMVSQNCGLKIIKRSNGDFIPPYTTEKIMETL